jgi:hypothetical protein
MIPEYESVYKVITPAGVFDAVFGEDDVPVFYQGDDAAIQFFKNWLSLNQISGEHGVLINAARITPNELHGFCQPPDSGITVVPPLDDALDFAEQDEMESDDSEGNEVMLKNESALDSVTGIEKINLVKELSGIRETMKTVTSGIEKLGFVKRINEIRRSIGMPGSSSDTVDIPLIRPPIEQAKIADVENFIPVLKRFIGDAQLSVMLSSAKGEEGQFFIDKLIEVANTVSTMPKTYEQDGKGDEAIVYLHYFKGSADWYITERDMEDEQLQAFGLADLFGDGGELGYVSIDELIASGVELDLHWVPKTLQVIKNGDSNYNQNNGIG